MTRRPSWQIAGQNRNTLLITLPAKLLLTLTVNILPISTAQATLRHSGLDECISRVVAVRVPPASGNDALSHSDAFGVSLLRQTANSQASQAEYECPSGRTPNAQLRQRRRFCVRWRRGCSSQNPCRLWLLCPSPLSSARRSRTRSLARSVMMRGRRINVPRPDQPDPAESMGACGALLAKRSKHPALHRKQQQGGDAWTPKRGSYV